MRIINLCVAITLYLNLFKMNCQENELIAEKTIQNIHLMELVLMGKVD